jgi:5-methylcytosine-specific restriction endonuclease McrA
MSVVLLTNQLAYWDDISRKRALHKIVKGKASILAHNGKICWRSKDGIEIPDPLVIHLKDFSGDVKWKSDEVPFTARGVFERDDNYCQYWHKYKIVNDQFEVCEPYKYKCTAHDRTIDHVIPRSRGGQNTFENVVTCCRYCNEIIKRNKLPEEAGLKLIKKPTVPRRVKGERVIRRFLYNPKNKAHKAFLDLFPHIKEKFTVS